MRNSGKEMIQRFDELLKFINKKGWKTGLYRDLIQNESKK